MSDDADDEQGESIDESEQQAADSDQASAQSDHQTTAGEESADQPGDQSTNEEATPASEDQPASEEERTGQFDNEPVEGARSESTSGTPAATSGSEGKAMDEAIRNKLELDLQSADVTPAPAKTGDCSSWENDPRGFAKIVADNYLSTEFDHMPGLVAPEGMSCWSSQPNKNVSDFCYLHYSDGWNVIVSLSNIPDYVKARAIAPERKPMCTYSYDCTGTGTLVFTKRGCYP